MSHPAPANLQDDIVSAFSVETDKVFNRRNRQVYAIVGKNPELKIVSEVWFGRFDTQAEFRAVLQHIFDLFGDGDYRYWLADLRFLTSSFDESKEWLVNQLMPAMFNAGLEREAVVLPAGAIDEEGQDVFAAASDALQKITDGRVRSFTDIQTAKKWLLSGGLPELKTVDANRQEQPS